MCPVPNGVQRDCKIHECWTERFLRYAIKQCNECMTKNLCMSHVYDVHAIKCKHMCSWVLDAPALRRPMATDGPVGTSSTCLPSLPVSVTVCGWFKVAENPRCCAQCAALDHLVTDPFLEPKTLNPKPVEPCLPCASVSVETLNPTKPCRWASVQCGSCFRIDGWDPWVRLKRNETSLNPKPYTKPNSFALARSLAGTHRPVC